MELSNEIVLRPRFTLDLDEAPAIVLSAFENITEDSNGFKVSRSEDHIFIRFPKAQQHFWSPQLHLEISSTEGETTVLKGLYGPSPTVWTLFMFLHFVVATLFIGVSIWLYTSVRLEYSTLLPTISLVVLFLLWFVLYFSGRLGRSAGKDEMHKLQAFMYKIINNSLSTIKKV
jgi:hypothetical protein